MGIYIPVKMPKQKSIFIEITPYGGVNEIINPLLSVPLGLATELPPHGDLIDRSKIGLTDFEIIMCHGDFKKGLKRLSEKIENAPTIIPADGGGQ